MSFRQMRVFIMFDLPTETVSDRSAYRHFRKLLINSGFIMMQESIYTKLCLNGSEAKCVIDNIKKNKPEKGLVQLLTITEKQYANMEYLVGKNTGEYLSTTERLVVL